MGLLAEVKLVLKGLLARKGRSFLTILGIVIGVSGVIVIISLGAGAQSLVLGQINKLGSNLIAIQPGKSNDNGPPAAVFGISIKTLVPGDAEAIADKTRFPHILAVSGYVRGAAPMIWRDQSIDSNFTGVQATQPNIQNIEIEAGRFFDSREELGANVAVLGYDVKDQLFGNQDPIGQIIKIKNQPFQVIGYMKKMGTVAFQNQDDQVYIPLVIAQNELLGVRNLQQINAKVDSSANIPQTIEEVRQLLRERHNIKAASDEDFTIRNLADAIKILTTITSALSLFLTMMAAIALVVGGIGIMNIMLVTVTERTREIGLRKAVGATSRAVRNQFLLEALVVTVLGGIVGVVLGVGIAYAIALGARYAGYDWAFVISYVSVILAIGVSALTGIIFGLYPAVKAAQLNPIDALRHE